jgi:hypothetical protein
MVRLYAHTTVERDLLTAGAPLRFKSVIGEQIGDGTA